MNTEKVKERTLRILGWGIVACLAVWLVFGGHKGYTLIAGLFYYVILWNNRYLPSPVGIYRYAIGMHDEPDSPDGHHDGESLVEPQPFCVGCPDHEGCGQGGCYLDGGPNRPQLTREPNTCTHKSGHEHALDPNGILGYSCEDVAQIDVRNEGFKTRAWIERERKEEALRNAPPDVTGAPAPPQISLSGAPPAERREWIQKRLDDGVYGTRKELVKGAAVVFKVSEGTVWNDLTVLNREGKHGGSAGQPDSR